MKRIPKPKLVQTEDGRLERLEERVASLEALLRTPERIESDALYLPAEVAEILKCSKSNVYVVIGNGELAVTRIGTGTRGFRVKGSAIVEFIDSRSSGGPRPKSAFKYLKTSFR